jgi:hypothetical protein
VNPDITAQCLNGKLQKQKRSLVESQSRRLTFVAIFHPSHVLLANR